MNNRYRVTIAVFAFLVSVSHAVDFHSHLINGTPVPDGKFGEVVAIRPGASGCTATVVGPRTIITAGHCSLTGIVENFTAAGVTYRATMTRSTTTGLDLALGYTDKEIVNVTPASIGGTVSQGLGITLLGYGCVDGANPQFDDKLRMGDTVITQLNALTALSNKPNGAALCFGDSGGPAFVIDGTGTHLLVGVNTNGDLREKNTHARTDVAETKTLLQTFITQNNNAQICGVNMSCGGGPAAPKCSLNASPNPVQLGNTLSLSLTIQGQVQSANIDGTPVTGPDWKKVFSPNETGTRTATGTVVGPTGLQGTCVATYTVNNVPNNPPTCTLTANPREIQLGQSLNLTLTTSGEVTSAKIDDQNVGFPTATLPVTPTSGGIHASVATVSGPGGTNTCRATYTVKPTDPNPPGPTTNYTIVPTYCGANALTETNVKSVCLGLVKFSHARHDQSIRDVLVVTYRDGSTEALPLINQVDRPKDPWDLRTTSDLSFYTNTVVKMDGNLGLATKPGVMTKLTPETGGSPIPETIQGKTSTGVAFVVRSLGRISDVNN